MHRWLRALAALTVLSTLLVAVPAAPAAAAEDKRLCHHETWGGTYYCKYHHEVRTLPNGTIYFIVVNVNYQVWARWRNQYGQFSAWTGLGGQVWRGDPARGVADGTPDDLRTRLCDDFLVVRVRGTSGEWYWRARLTTGQWTPNWINYVNLIPGC
jgi:hypothetical protein